MSARWPYRVRTQHTIDGNNSFVVDLQDHTVPDAGVGSASQASSIVARYIGSSESRHTIRISVPRRERYAVVDTLMYVRRAITHLYLIIIVVSFEVEESDSSTPPARPIATSAQTSAGVRATSSTNITATAGPFGFGESSSTDKERKLTIILGILGPFLALFFVLLFVYLYYRRRTRTKEPEVDDFSPLRSKEGMRDDASSIRVLRPSDASYFTGSDVPHITVIGPYLPYTPHQGPGESLAKPSPTYPSSPSIPFSPDRMVRQRPQAF
jgi:hypothetical protein